MLALGLGAAHLHAHPVHVSTAEAEYNAQTRMLEVSLTVFLDDLETALIRQVEREMSFEKTPAAEFDRETMRYLDKTFVLQTAGGRQAETFWVGRRLDEATARSEHPCLVLHFEVSLPTGLNGCTLTHRVFTGMFKDQDNLLLLRAGDRKQQFRFRQDAATQRLEAGP